MQKCRLEDVRLSAEQSAAFSQLGEASERHVLPPLSPDRAEAHGRRDDDVSGWATGANPDAPGAFRAGAGTAGTPAREPVTSNQNESPSMPVPSPGPSSAMQAVEHGEGPSKTGAGDSDSPGMPPKPGPNPRPPSAKASPNTGEPSRPATRESAGRAVAEAEADAQEGGASQSPGARDAPGEAGLTGQESEIFSIEPSLAVAEESSGALAPSGEASSKHPPRDRAHALRRAPRHALARSPTRLAAGSGAAPGSLRCRRCGAVFVDFPGALSKTAAAFLADALGERTRRAADLVAKIDGAMAEALARAAQGVTADISLSSSAWSIKMGLDRTQAALVSDLTPLTCGPSPWTAWTPHRCSLVAVPTPPLLSPAASPEGTRGRPSVPGRKHSER